jgi:putative peptidoglycan lipid II flippase
MFVVLILLSILGMLIAPVLVMLCAPGFLLENHHKYNLTVQLTILLFPYIFLVGMYAFFMSVLNVKKIFAISALGPCLMNVGMILGAVSSYFLLNGSIYGLVAGVLVGGIFQMFIQIPHIKRMFFPWRISFRFFNSPMVKKSLNLLLPRMLGSAVYLANTFVDTIFASLRFLVGEAGVIAIYFSTRIFQFPLAVFGVSTFNVSLPFLAGYAAENNREKFVYTLSHSLRSILAVLLPSSAFFIALGFPLIKILFHRGAFDLHAVQITQDALMFYSIGLFSYGCVKVLTGGFYAMQDTKTPVKVSFLCLILNIILNIIFTPFLKISGLALATSISSFVNLFSLSIILKKRIGKMDGRRIGITFIKSILSSILFGIYLFFSYMFLLNIFDYVISFFISLSTGVILFFLLVYILKIEEIWELVHYWKKK